jgi:hypothetical protein
MNKAYLIIERVSVRFVHLKNDIAHVDLVLHLLSRLTVQGSEPHHAIVFYQFAYVFIEPVVFVVWIFFRQERADLIHIVTFEVKSQIVRQLTVLL